MSESWPTVEDARSALARLEEEHEGWERPAAYGLVVVPPERLGSDDVDVVVATARPEVLPPVVLAMVVGRTAETATYEVSRQQLSLAVERLAEAEGWDASPDLTAWRGVLATWAQRPDDLVFAVFVARLADEPSSPYDVAVRRAATSPS